MRCLLHEIEYFLTEGLVRDRPRSRLFIRHDRDVFE